MAVLMGWDRLQVQMGMEEKSHGKVDTSIYPGAIIRDTGRHGEYG